MAHVEGSAELWGHKGHLTATEQTALDGLRAAVVEHGLGEAYTKTKCLLRFLRARKFVVKKALRMAIEESQWRDQFRGHEFKLADFPSLLQFNDDGVVRCGGRDRSGRPVIYLVPGLFFPAQVGSDEELVLFFVFFMDSLLVLAEEGGREDFTVVCDMSGWSFKNFSLPLIRLMINILQNYYPERLGRVFVINTPYLFKAAWSMIYPILDERTRLKIHILGKNKEAILKDIDADSLEDKYGGRHPEYPFRDQIVSPLYEREELISREIEQRILAGVEGGGDASLQAQHEFSLFHDVAEAEDEDEGEDDDAETSAGVSLRASPPRRQKRSAFRRGMRRVIQALKFDGRDSSFAEPLDPSAEAGSPTSAGSPRSRRPISAKLSASVLGMRAPSSPRSTRMATTASGTLPASDDLTAKVEANASALARLEERLAEQRATLDGLRAALEASKANARPVSILRDVGRPSRAASFGTLYFILAALAACQAWCIWAVTASES